MNTRVTIKEITFVVLKFPEISRPESFTGEVYQMFKKKLAPILHNFSQKTEKKGYFPIHFIKLVSACHQKYTIKKNKKKGNCSSLFNTDANIFNKTLENKI